MFATCVELHAKGLDRVDIEMLFVEGDDVLIRVSASLWFLGPDYQFLLRLLALLVIGPMLHDQGPLFLLVIVDHL